MRSPARPPGSPASVGPCLIGLRQSSIPIHCGETQSILQFALINIKSSSNLEIVVAGVENDTNIVDVRVEVVEKLPVINVGQLITGLDKTTN